MCLPSTWTHCLRLSGTLVLYVLPYKHNLIIAFATFLFVNELQVTSRHPVCFISLCRIRNLLRSDSSPLSIAPCSITLVFQGSSETSAHGVVVSETYRLSNTRFGSLKTSTFLSVNTWSYPQDECRNVCIHRLVR